MGALVPMSPPTVNIAGEACDEVLLATGRRSTRKATLPPHSPMARVRRVAIGRPLQGLLASRDSGGDVKSCVPS